MTGTQYILGVQVHALNYDAVIERAISAAREKRPYSVTALAVHGLMTGYLDPQQRNRLNAFDLVLPDGQPVRWALNWLHGCGLRNRVSGPQLMPMLCEAAAREGISIYLYGSQQQVLDRLQASLQKRFPTLRIAGAEPSRFRQVSTEEQQEAAARIRASGAGMVFVGLGCPRQEVWVYEHRELLPMPALAVGAAFDFIAGNLPKAPEWMGHVGLEWLFRLAMEPRRLWRRYVFLNPLYIWGVLWQRLGWLNVSVRPPDQPKPLRYG